MFKVGNVTPAADRVPDGHYCTTREAQNGVVWLDWDKANEEVKVGLLNKSNHTYTNTHTQRERTSPRFHTEVHFQNQIMSRYVTIWFGEGKGIGPDVGDKSQT